MALPQLDDIWTACAAALELPVLRGGDSYVHFDGRALRVSNDNELDADDSLAQLVLHEICHLLVQGPGQRYAVDWGLDNTGGTPFDDVRERAAVRLQAHLSGGYGLRSLLFPTTVIRSFFESLAVDALAPIAGEPDDGSCALAICAATRAGKQPYRGALSRALRDTAMALALPEHRSGASRADDRRCGTCVWRSASGRCHAADHRIFVRNDEPGCARHEAALDCLRCGACCRSGYDAVPAGARDRVRKLHPSLLVVQSSGHDLARREVGAESRCVALDGEASGPYACSIYDDRPRACSQLPAGEGACLTARRRVGLSVT